MNVQDRKTQTNKKTNKKTERNDKDNNYCCLARLEIKDSTVRWRRRKEVGKEKENETIYRRMFVDEWAFLTTLEELILMDLFSEETQVCFFVENAIYNRRS